MIYCCKKIEKDRDYDIEKGDVGWLKTSESPDVIADCRILLSDVRCWEDYIEAIPYFKNPDKKIKLHLKDSPTLYIVEDIKNFDKVMEDFIQKQHVFKNN